MSISQIIRHFEALGRAPIEITDVLKQIQSVVLDERVEIEGYNRPATKLRGYHHRYHIPPHPDSALMPERVAVAAYSVQQENGWQRLVCCKELIHIFDREPIRTSSKDEVVRLGHHIGGGEKFDKIDASNMQGFFDQIAVYQALAILFPFGLREAIVTSGKTIDVPVVANHVDLPMKWVSMVLNDRWPLLRESLLAAG